MAKDVYFRVSTGLKSIIGRELITDDFIAVFELVKNAFDANAKRVDITFEELDTPNATLTIKDNGKGMSASDIQKKWLFVAYSAKKEGVEDYRQDISHPRIYAGAKGIGRFSCDKLGSDLELFSRPTTTGSISRLSVDWNAFEEDAKEEFVDIPCELSTVRTPPPGFTKGTLIRISGLRETWDREKLQKLKGSLGKLINPNQSRAARDFKVFIHARSQKAEDAEVSDDTSWKRVNGEVTNFVFENLKIKTTLIKVSVSEKEITTRLEDRGRFVYEIVETNPFAIHDIDIRLFALNQAAKNTFTRTMGVHAVRFGSVFLFKNGFRVYPYGEEGKDPWGIDVRKQQGQARFLGTRDLIGRVEIGGDNATFKETTSRDGGLIENPATRELQSLFFTFALKRLERFAVDIVKWGTKESDSGEVKSKILELILSLTKSENLTSVQYDPKIIDIVREASEKSLHSLISQFRSVAETTDNPQLEKDARKAERRIRELEEARSEAEAEAEKAEKAKDTAEKEAEEQKKRAKKAESRKKKVESQNLFLQSLVSSDTENLIGLHHHIGISAGTIRNYVKTMVKRISSGKPVTTGMFLESLEKISMQASQIESATRFATKANFSLDAALITEDMIAFVREYVQNVCQGMIYTTSNHEMKFVWKGNSAGDEFIHKFRPFEVVVLVDNLISNAKKANAKTVTWIVGDVSKRGLVIRILDDGNGVKPGNVPKIFDLGFTTTSGSGFGLFHAHSIAKSLGGSLTLNSKNRRTTEFVWEVQS